MNILFFTARLRLELNNKISSKQLRCDLIVIFPRFCKSVFDPKQINDNDVLTSLGLFLLLATTTATSPLDCSSLPAKVLLREAHLLSLPPSALSGTWTSTRCETRPGPEFVLRRYTFQPVAGINGSEVVTGVLYHYADPSCSHPIHSITMQGRMVVRYHLVQI